MSDEPLPRRQPGADLPTKRFAAVPPAAGTPAPLFRPAGEDQRERAAAAIAAAEASGLLPPPAPLSAWFEPDLPAACEVGDLPPGVPPLSLLEDAVQLLTAHGLVDVAAWVADWAESRL